MTDAQLRNALKRRAELRLKVEADTVRLRQLRLSLDADVAEIASLSELIAARQVVPVSVRETSPSGVPLNPDRATVIEAVTEMIRGAGMPLHRDEIGDRLRERGLVLRGRWPDRMLNRLLWKEKTIVRLEGHGYWLAATPYPPACYQGLYQA